MTSKRVVALALAAGLLGVGFSLMSDASVHWTSLAVAASFAVMTFCVGVLVGRGE